MAKLIAFVLLLLISPVAYAATTHTVGGTSGWNTGVNYGDWASGQTFAVGDSLSFTYDGTHAVEEVTQSDYQSCSISNPVPRQPPPSPPAPARGKLTTALRRSQPFTTIGVSRDATFYSVFSRPGWWLASILGGRNSLMAGFSLVLAAVVGVMG
ncbi:UNVERIFIED_CONTAM: hypothetical protein Sangu_0042900 [Sesamum angustifolium]|uniref:Phytocyanin domain-containing protein n=1 Tax=Sesamum angustifolium TaxID=2727405 RepID=A0AAW2RK48_9LAMI